MNKGYSKKNIDKIKRLPTPRVLLNVCTHGNEVVGLKVERFFSKLKINKGTLIINVANKRAINAQRRYISSDLNRVFPGKKEGNYEEQLAFKMSPFIKSFDFVIDVHSTETGMKPAVIVTRLNNKIIPLLKASRLKRVIQMSATKSNALISQAKIGVAFECGKDKDPQTFIKTREGIIGILHYLKMIELKKSSPPTKEIELYEVNDSFTKPNGFVVSNKIKNYELVKKGTVVGYKPNTRIKIKSDKNFYPILFGKNSYKDIFGFVARRKTI